MAEPLPLTERQSSIEAQKIMMIGIQIQTLDLEYLTEAAKQMSDMHSFRESAAILNPNPFSHSEKQDMDSLKIKQLELLLDLRRNHDEIQKAKARYLKAEIGSEELKRMFS